MSEWRALRKDGPLHKMVTMLVGQEWTTRPKCGLWGRVYEPHATQRGVMVCVACKQP